MKDNIAWNLTMTSLGWVMALMFYILYINKPTQLIEQVNECQLNYDLKTVETAGKICNSQGGVLTGYRVGDYTDEITVSLDCEFTKKNENNNN